MNEITNNNFERKEGINMNKTRRNSNSKEVTCGWSIGLVLGAIAYFITNEVLFLSLGLTAGLLVGCVALYIKNKKNQNPVKRICQKEFPREMRSVLNELF